MLRGTVVLAAGSHRHLMGKQHYYAVARGRNPGIYTSWDSCKKQVDKFQGNLYKGFPTEEAAAAFLQEHGSGLAEEGRGSGLATEGNSSNPCKEQWQSEDMGTTTPHAVGGEGTVIDGAMGISPGPDAEEGPSNRMEQYGSLVWRAAGPTQALRLVSFERAPIATVFHSAITPLPHPPTNPAPPPPLTPDPTLMSKCQNVLPPPPISCLHACVTNWL
jgi:hypothetical protein